MRDTFFFRREHAKLLQNAVVRWEDCEFGAPSIDCKRPYGNTSVYEDMCEILEWDYNSVDKKRLRELHEETEIALQITLTLGRIQPGTYSRVGYKWYLQASLEPAQ